jgi:glycosyltransferase involved in cell wall biosynthesis
MVLPGLRKYGIESTVYLSKASLLDGFARNLEASQVKVQRYSGLDQVSNAGYDLQLIQAWQPSTYPKLLAQRSIPSTIVIHEQIEYRYPVFHHMYRAAFKITRLPFLKQADALITVSSWATQWLKRYSAGHQLFTLHNGVDTQRFSPTQPHQREMLRNKLGFTRATVVVPGRFSLEKNQPLALKVARQLPDTDFYFMGDMDSSIGWVCQQLKQLWKLDNVHFMGRHSDMPDIYRAADVLLQPTFAENQSLVTLEAMSSGLTVVSSNIPAQNEIIQHRRTGLTANINVQDMKTALQQALNDGALREQIGQAAREQVLNYHTAERCTHQAAHILQQIAQTSLPISTN